MQEAVEAVQAVEVAQAAAEMEMAQLQAQRKNLKRKRDPAVEEQEIDKKIKEKEDELQRLEEERKKLLRRKRGKAIRSPTPQDNTKQELEAARLKIKELEERILELEGRKKND